MTAIVNVTCEYRSEPLGIDVRRPRLAWQMQTDRRGARQTAYRILAASQPDRLQDQKADLWDSGKVESDQSVHIVYGGQPLPSRQRVYWQVTVWDETDESNTSRLTWFEIGLLDRTDWQAQWIGAGLVGGPYSPIPAPYLRRAFTVPEAIRSARLYITALGFYDCTLNGQPISADVFAPGWTDYQKRVQYKVYDVADLLHTGENAIGAILGDGWAVGHVGWESRQHYADRPHLFAQLEITLESGQRLTISTDERWKYQFGALLDNDLQGGEAYDARREMPGWDQRGFDDVRWLPAESKPDPGMALVATNGPTVRRMAELAPLEPPIDQSNTNRYRFIYDMGQNMVGRVRIRGSAPAGTTITLHFAEVLNPDGSLYTTNLRTARATDYYTFKDEGEEEWEPKFTFHGFRYVQIGGYPNGIANLHITGIVLYSDMRSTGHFECSDPLLNQLQQNIVWGQRGNFIDIPTDCPQRDERLGWTGDIQVFVRTAAYNMQVAGFMTKWMHDVADAQNAAGEIPPFAPNISARMTDGGPAWADAAIICPYTMYLCYGDTDILAANYDVMTRFMDFLLRTSPGYIRCAPDYEGWLGFGDWLAISAVTPRDLIGTAFLAYDAHLMAEIAQALNKPDDAAKYAQLFDAVKSAFGARYLKGSTPPVMTAAQMKIRQQMDDMDMIAQGNAKVVDYGPIPSEVFNTDLFKPIQTAYVLALHFNLLPEDLSPLAARELVADIQRRDLHLSTGFVGSPYLAHVLQNNGQSETAFALLNQQTWPSWLYSVTQGATTIWERWDGWTPQSGFQSPDMNSFNHYAYGAIGAWLYNTIAGIEIDPAQPGYKHAILHPQPGGGLTHATGTLNTLYGDLVSDWKIEDDVFHWRVVVPPNTTASAYLPIKNGQHATLNGKNLTEDCVALSAGEYHFQIA